MSQRSGVTTRIKLTNVAAATLIVLVIVVGFLAAVNFAQTGQVGLPSWPAGGVVTETIETGEGGTPVIAKPITIAWTIRSYDSYNKTTDIDSWGTMTWYRPNAAGTGIGEPGPTLTDDDSTDISIPASDAYKGYLVIDYGTNTVGTVNPSMSLADPYFVSQGLGDPDLDNIEERYFAVDFSSLGALVAGESKKTVASNLYIDRHQTNAVTCTSTSNATSISQTQRQHYYAEGYVGSWTGRGYTLKLVYLKMSLPDAGNATYADPANSYFQLKDVTIGDVVFSDVGAFDVANKQWIIDVPGVDSTSEPEQFVKFFYDRDFGATWMTIKIHAYCKYPSASQAIVPTLTMTFVAPDGSTWTETRVVSFSS